jgi:hypothetical protein
MIVLPKSLASLLLRAGVAKKPRVVTCGRYVEGIAHPGDRPCTQVLLDEGVTHDDTRAKRVAACFRMSRSALRWRSSSSTEGTLSCPGKAWSEYARRAYFHRRSYSVAMPRLLVTSDTDFPFSVTNFTAATLN